MKNESVISRIISAIFGTKVAVRENLYYDTLKGALDFAPDDLPNTRAVQSWIPGGGGTPVETPIVGSTTANPITVAYPAGFSNPTLIFRKMDGSTYTGAVNSVDNAYDVTPVNSITLTGDDDGAGHFVDSFMFIIKA